MLPHCCGRYFWTAWWGCSARLSASAPPQPMWRLESLKVMACTSSADRERVGGRNGREEGRVERSREAGRQAAVRGLNKTCSILRSPPEPLHTQIRAGQPLGQDGTRKGCWVHILISVASDGSGVSPVLWGLCCVK